MGQIQTLSESRSSKLPGLNTTIFTVMSQLAQQYGAINLGQGFPDFEPDPHLLEAVGHALKSGMNQYAPMAGLPALRKLIAGKITHFGGCDYDPDTEITVTAGATQALTTALLALVQTHDEVIVLDPCYDSYEPAVRLAGGTAVHVPMTRDYRPDWEQIVQAITPRTRALIINSPHNPSGTVWTREDFETLQTLTDAQGLWVLADEVYEHMAYDGSPHLSVSQFPGLAQRSVLVSSFGKSLHVTGWKIAYAAAPAWIMQEFRKVHQFNVFSVATPLQAGIAHHLAQSWEPLEALPGFYQKKRDVFRAGLSDTGFELLPCEGTYFQVVDYSRLSDMDDVAYARWLTTERGVAAIPLSGFYEKGSDLRRVRFCFAKKESTLASAIERLKTL